MLREFIVEHRDAILGQARLRVAARNAPAATESELTKGLPMFLDQLGEALRRAESKEEVDHVELERTAGQHGSDLFRRGLTVAQVVHDYGDLCQVITTLAVDQTAHIAASEFRTLNLCLDDAIAGAVTEYSHQRERAAADVGTERLGVLAHEMRNLLNSAVLSFASIRSGSVPPGGSTGVIHNRSLTGLQTLVDRSLADVRLDAGMQNIERVSVRELLEELEIGATLLAVNRGLHFGVVSVDATVIVDADRQILAAAVANLLHNAFKFTHPGSAVTLRAVTTATRVLIEVEDQCGGLPPGKVEDLLRPFRQGHDGRDLTGLGLGLSICLKAVKAMNGELHVRDLPGKGCVFSIDLPKQPPPPTSLEERRRKVATPGTPGAAGGLARRGAVVALRP